MSEAGLDDSQLLTHAKAMEYFQVKGLFTHTGLERVQDFDLYDLKELVDNALDESASKVDITIKYDGRIKWISIRQNRGHFPSDWADKVLDYTRTASTKYYVRAPKRGAVGDALKCVIASPYVLSRESNVTLPNFPIVVRTDGSDYQISLDINRVAETVKAKIIQSIFDNDITEVTIALPSERHDPSRYIGMIRGYSLVNPDVTFTLDVDEKRSIFPASCGKERSFDGASSIWWYSMNEFQDHVDAEKRRLITSNSDTTPRQFVKMFRGLRGDKAASHIMRQAGLEALSSLKELTPERTATLHKIMRENTNAPHPLCLGYVGEISVREALSMMVQHPLASNSFKYKRVVRNERYGSEIVPFMLEVALAVKELGSREVYTAVNFSAQIYNPFNYWILPWTDRQKRERKSSGLTGLLDDLGIKIYDPTIILVHLVSPRIEWKSYGKGYFNINPFAHALIDSIKFICNFYRNKYRIGRPAGHLSDERRLVLQELLRRKALLEKYGEISREERLPQDVLWYQTRKKLGGRIGMKRKSFMAMVSQLCMELGEGDPLYREKIGLYASERGFLIFNHEVYPVTYENIKKVVNLGSDLLVVEKEGLASALEDLAAEYGVALLVTRGFSQRSPDEVIREFKNLTEHTGGNVFLVSDFDDSGLLIAKKLPEGVIRIGIDLQMVKDLKLNRTELEEIYEKGGKPNPPEKRGHWKALQKIDPQLAEEVKNTRIEIDSVLSFIGSERFWNYCMKIMRRERPMRDLTRSIKVSPTLPNSIMEPLSKIEKYIAELQQPMIEDTLRPLRSWDGEFVKVHEKAQEIQRKAIELAEGNAVVKEIGKRLDQIALGKRTIER